jgi:uracil-DNA glycosylase
MSYFIHIFGNYCPKLQLDAIFARIPRPLPGGGARSVRNSPPTAFRILRIPACPAISRPASPPARSARPLRRHGDGACPAARPWFDGTARLLIAGQAPGLRVHAAGRPFADPSGDRLRDWLGLAAPDFYDLARVAIVPMAFCFPGYDAAGRRPAAAAPLRPTWRAR